MNLRDAFKKALSENGGVLPVNGKKISKPANKAQTSIHPKKTSASKVIADVISKADDIFLSVLCEV